MDSNPVVSGSTNAFNSGVHIVSETADPGYFKTVGGDCAADGSVTLVPGTTKTCTVTNEEIVLDAVPALDSPSASSITATSAVLGATVQSLGVPSVVTARGVCVGTSPNPSWESGATCLAAGLSQEVPGTFTVSAAFLAPATTYHFRGFATNSTGTGYSIDSTFTTEAAPVVPIVANPTVSSIGTTTVTLGAEIVFPGVPSAIISRGTCWGTLPAPVTNCVAEGGTTSGVFTQARSGFVPGVTYYFRGYATNGTGTGYSADSTFSTATQVFSVTATNSANYRIDGVNDPVLTLQRGRRYVFTINAPGHPFWIKLGNTSKTAGTGNAYSDGVTNNGATSGQIIFDVPLSAPASNLYYICELHSQMNANINTTP